VNTLSIVILSLFLGLFIASLIALCLLLLYQQHQLKSTIASIQSSFPSMINNVSELLSIQSQSLNNKLSQINGVRLEQFSTQAILAAQRIEKAAVLLGELCTHLLSEDAIQSVRTTRDGEGSLGPNDFAPDDGTPYVSVSKNARQDQELLLRQQLGDRATHGRERGYQIPNIYNHNGSSSPVDGSEPFDLDSISPGLEEKAGGDE
jgi:hypothetical protein